MKCWAGGHESVRICIRVSVGNSRSYFFMCFTGELCSTIVSLETDPLHSFVFYIMHILLFLQNPSAPGMHNIGSSPSDSHVRVSYKDNPGFFKQVQESFCASLFGILLVIVSFPVIYWNEVRMKAPRGSILSSPFLI